MQYNIYYAQKDYIATCLTDIHATEFLWDEQNLIKAERNLLKRQKDFKDEERMIKAKEDILREKEIRINAKEDILLEKENSMKLQQQKETNLNIKD